MTAQRAGSVLVSLIMPVWQPRRDWLNQSIDSALAQSDCDIELIIVDDGCNTAVRDLVVNAADERVRFVRVPHGGPGAARNAGIAAARGEWLRFIDADDVLPPGSTRHLSGLMDGHRIVAYGSTLLCDDDLVPHSTIESTLQGNVLSDCLLGRFSTRHPSMLFPRCVIDAAGPWDPTFEVSEDWDFVLRALEHAQVRGDREIVTLYRRHGGSTSGSASVAVGEQFRHRLIANYFERHPDQRGGALEREALTASHLDRAQAYWAARQYRPAVDRFTRAVRTRPLTGALGVARFLGRGVRRRLATAAQRVAVSPSRSVLR